MDIHEYTRREMNILHETGDEGGKMTQGPECTPVLPSLQSERFVYSLGYSTSGLNTPAGYQ